MTKVTYFVFLFPTNSGLIYNFLQHVAKGKNYWRVSHRILNVMWWSCLKWASCPAQTLMQRARKGWMISGYLNCKICERVCTAGQIRKFIIQTAWGRLILDWKWVLDSFSWVWSCFLPVNRHIIKLVYLSIMILLKLSSGGILILSNTKL